MAKVGGWRMAQHRTAVVVTRATMCAAMLAPVPSSATTLGAQAAICNSNKSAVLVTISGFKKRAGTITVQLYANTKSTFMERDKWLQQIDMPVAKTGTMAICVPATPGSYAIFVHHDMNGNRKSDRSDGSGFSGNPNYTFTDAILKKKPSLARTAFAVGPITAKISVILNYVDGISVGPVG